MGIVEGYGECMGSWIGLDGVVSIIVYDIWINYEQNMNNYEQILSEIFIK